MSVTVSRSGLSYVVFFRKHTYMYFRKYFFCTHHEKDKIKTYLYLPIFLFYFYFTVIVYLFYLFLFCTCDLF